VICQKVVLSAAALRQIRAEIRRVKRFETGGALVGEVLDGTVRVTAASGPGPQAESRFTSILIDGDHATTFRDQEFDRSNGRIDYVGDWHCHPGWSLTPSSRDNHAMEVMAEHTPAVDYCPVSLIFARWSRRWKAFQYRGSLVEIKCAAEK
jgi:integrative and conjugative element protein (TIGR02256 family)